MASYYRLTVHKAKKPHKCCECGGTIQIGEVYNKHWGVWNGEAEIFKVCQDCDRLRDELNEERGCPDEFVPFTGLSEEINNVDEDEYLHRFAEIMIKRGADLPLWLKDRVN